MKFYFALPNARFSELKKARCKILPHPVLYSPLIVASLMLFADGATTHFCNLTRQTAANFIFLRFKWAAKWLYSLAKFYLCGKRNGLNLTASFKISS